MKEALIKLHVLSLFSFPFNSDIVVDDLVLLPAN